MFSPPPRPVRRVCRRSPHRRDVLATLRDADLNRQARSPSLSLSLSNKPKTPKRAKPSRHRTSGPLAVPATPRLTDLRQDSLEPVPVPVPQAVSLFRGSGCASTACSKPRSAVDDMMDFFLTYSPSQDDDSAVRDFRSAVTPAAAPHSLPVRDDCDTTPVVLSPTADHSPEDGDGTPVVPGLSPTARDSDPETTPVFLSPTATDTDSQATVPMSTPTHSLVFRPPPTPTPAGDSQETVPAVTPTGWRFPVNTAAPVDSQETVVTPNRWRFTPVTPTPPRTVDPSSDDSLPPTVLVPRQRPPTQPLRPSDSPLSTPSTVDSTLYDELCVASAQPAGSTHTTPPPGTAQTRPRWRKVSAALATAAGCAAVEGETKADVADEDASIWDLSRRMQELLSPEPGSPLLFRARHRSPAHPPMPRHVSAAGVLRDRTVAWMLHKELKDSEDSEGEGGGGAGAGAGAGSGSPPTPPELVDDKIFATLRVIAATVSSLSATPPTIPGPTLVVLPGRKVKPFVKALSRSCAPLVYVGNKRKRWTCGMGVGDIDPSDDPLPPSAQTSAVLRELLSHSIVVTSFPVLCSQEWRPASSGLSAGWIRADGQDDDDDDRLSCLHQIRWHRVVQMPTRSSRSRQHTAAIDRLAVAHPKRVWTFVEKN